MLNKLKQLNGKVWAWCKNSGTILLARSQAIIGLLIASLGAMDWTPLVGFVQSTTGFDYKQLAWMGVFMFTQSVIYELVRRRKGSQDPV